MSRSLTKLSVLAWFCAVAWPAALVPVPSTPQPSFPVAGLEANQGQANTGILFLSPASGSSIAVAAQSVLFSPLGATLNLVASNPNPAVSFSNPLPGLVNSYTGADSHKWISGIPRYATATISAIYPGINAEYTVDSSGILTLRLLLAPGANFSAVQFSIPQASSIGAGTSGLTAILGPGGNDAPRLYFSAPLASQTSPSGQISRSASFTVQSATSFGFSVQALDSTLLLQIAFQLTPPLYPPSQPNFAGTNQRAADAAGNTYYVIAVADAAGKTPPFPAISGTGCGFEIDTPFPCTDVAIYKYSVAGTLQFITYLAGGVTETPGFVGLTPDGKVAVAGTTDSTDFPVTSGAFQTSYAGPPPVPSDEPNFQGGDFFAALLDPATGHLQSATFFGSPNPDTLGTAAIGTDGSLYFLPASVDHFSAGLPVSTGALLPVCQSAPNVPCYNGYAARLSPALDKQIYGTYLPGMSEATAQLYSDGSVYYSGTAGAGFPTTPNAYQPQNSGGSNAIVARLDPTGSKLLFATYYGGPNSSGTFVLAAPIAVAPDGSVWVSVSEEQPHLIHLDASASRLLTRLPIHADSMVVDAAGNLIALVEGSIAVSPGAILGGSCGGPAYVKISPAGQQLFATYLPGGYQIAFDGADGQGTPYVDIPSGRFEVVENQSAPPNAGCVVDAASFFVNFSGATDQQLSPGGIVTIFGAEMGPISGVGFQLVNGQVPTSLAGTQVMVNGEPAPLLYSSYGQVNLVLPYDLQPGTKAEIQVVANGTPLNSISNVQIVAANISLFQVNGAAAALNQDYTVNSPQHPAQPGSTVMLFGTGGGQTSPPSVAGEVTPLELRPLATTPLAAIIGIPQMQPPVIFLNVEYAGVAPTLLSGVTQINVTLPDTIPVSTGYPPGTLHLQVAEPTLPSYQAVTIYANVPAAPTPSTAGAP